MVDMVKSHKYDAERPDHIIFDGQKVKTGHWIDVPEFFKIKIEFLSKPDVNQGVDISVKNGYVTLADGSEIKILRTWHDPKYDPIVEYNGYSKAKKVIVYNVYKVTRNDKVFDEKWTGNAGMLVDDVRNNEYILRCSSNKFNPPNFDSLVFKVSIREGSS
jgi:hypothetical protein